MAAHQPITTDTYQTLAGQPVIGYDQHQSGWSSGWSHPSIAAGQPGFAHQGQGWFNPTTASSKPLPNEPMVAYAAEKFGWGGTYAPWGHNVAPASQWSGGWPTSCHNGSAYAMTAAQPEATGYNDGMMGRWPNEHAAMHTLWESPACGSRNPAVSGRTETPRGHQSASKPSSRINMEELVDEVLMEEVGKLIQEAQPLKVLL